MSVLDRATNDALNAIIDLHAEAVRWNDAHDKSYAVCAHCTEIAENNAEIGAQAWIDYPCPTIETLTAVANGITPKGQP